MRHVFVELCAGSCAMSAALLGWPHAPVSYLGGKWRHRHILREVFARQGLVDNPRCIVYEPGPVGEIAPVLLRSERARRLAVDLAWALRERGGRWRFNGCGTSPSKLRSMRKLTQRASVDIESYRVASATPHDLPPGVSPSDCVVLFDPPYASTKGYERKGGDMDRAAVDALCRTWRCAGAAVVLTEATPVQGLTWPRHGALTARAGSRLSITEYYWAAP